jgi:O-methyltransferase
MTEIETVAKGEGIPVIGRLEGAIVQMLATLCGERATRVLELGTAIGYSALWLTHALPGGGKVPSIELAPERAAHAAPTTPHTMPKRPRSGATAPEGSAVTCPSTAVSDRCWVCRGMAAHRAGSAGGVKFGVALLRFVELVFEGDDAARRVDRGALVDQFPHPCGHTQLVAGVAAVSAGGTLRLDQPVLIEAA